MLARAGSLLDSELAPAAAAAAPPCPSSEQQQQGRPAAPGSKRRHHPAGDAQQAANPFAAAAASSCSSLSQLSSGTACSLPPAKRLVLPRAWAQDGRSGPAVLGVLRMPSRQREGWPAEELAGPLVLGGGAGQRTAPPLPQQHGALACCAEPAPGEAAAGPQQLPPPLMESFDSVGSSANAPPAAGACGEAEAGAAGAAAQEGGPPSPGSSSPRLHRRACEFFRQLQAQLGALEAAGPGPLCALPPLQTLLLELVPALPPGAPQPPPPPT